MRGEPETDVCHGDGHGVGYGHGYGDGHGAGHGRGDGHGRGEGTEALDGPQAGPGGDRLHVPNVAVDLAGRGGAA